MKAIRDAAKRVSELQGKASTELIVDAIKMHYMALAQARRAARELIEYEPSQAFAIGITLIGEIVAHDFLRDHINNSFRRVVWDRRDEEYSQTIPALYRFSIASVGPQWDMPKAVIKELFERYSKISPVAGEGNKALGQAA